MSFFRAKMNVLFFFFRDIGLREDCDRYRDIKGSQKTGDRDKDTKCDVERERIEIRLEDRQIDRYRREK